MSRLSSKTQARIKAGIPSILEVELSKEWQDDDDTLIYYGDQIAVRACDGTYWQANRDNGDKVMALAKHVKEWELIEIVSVDDEFVAKRKRPVRYNERVAFRFITNNSFISADLNSNGELVARVPWVKAWEMFTLLEHPQKPSRKDKKVRYGSWFALRACNEKYVMFDRDGTRQLYAWIPHIDEWEAFVFIKPSDVK